MRISDWSSDVCSSDLWDPKFGTAISDLEVETREVQGKFWHLKYPLEDGSGFIHVATTRPETMLADMAVAVHPEDERYTALIGKKIRHPITGRLIPIIADEHADPELDRKSVVSGKSVSVRVDLGGGGIFKKKKKKQ